MGQIALGIDRMFKLRRDVTARAMQMLLFCLSSVVSSFVFSFPITKVPVKVINPDVRLVIDVSSSMKSNDPHHIRFNAIDNLKDIFPEDSTVGVYFFGSDTLEIIQPVLLKHIKTEELKSIANKIHAQDNVTNIGEALEYTANDWVNPDQNENRNIILLTDGYLDVSDNGWENDEARAHVIQTVLPNLKALGVKVHAITFSEQANEPLLKQLSDETAGLYLSTEATNDIADALSEIHAYAIAPKIVPIEQRLINVAEKIDELTLLIHRRESHELTRIERPNGKRFTKDVFPKNVLWYNDSLIDIVTIQEPEVGTWKVISNISSGKSLKLFKKLALELTDLPENIYVGEKFDLIVYLVDGEQQVTDTKLLDTLEFLVEVRKDDDLLYTYPMYDDGLFSDMRKNDRKYSTTIGPFTPKDIHGELKIQIMAKGKTLNRKETLDINLMPIPVEIETDTYVSDLGESSFEIKISPDPELIQLDKFKVDATLVDDQGNKERHSLIKLEDQDIWQLKLLPKPSVKEYKTNFVIHGKTLSDRDVRLETDPVLLSVPVVTLPEPEVIVEVKEVERIVEYKEELDSKKIIIIISVLTVLNVLILVTVFLIRKLMKQSQLMTARKMTKQLDSL